MPVLPISHETWTTLRVLVRSTKPVPGRELRYNPTRRNKDGTFINELIRRGLLKRETGTERDPFEGTYSLTQLGQHAAEYGECEHNIEPVKPKRPRAK